MHFRPMFMYLLVLFMFQLVPSLSAAETAAADLEQAMSDTLDLWREGRYEQLYERLSHRGKTSKEKFVARMRGTSIRPSCCWQKMENFKVLNEKLTEATVYAKIGLDGTSNPSESVTREFKLSHDHGAWKMYLNDVNDLAGITGKKAKKPSRRKSIKVLSP